MRVAVWRKNLGNDKHLTAVEPPAAAAAAGACAPTTCATRHAPGGATNGRPFWRNDLNNFAPVVSLAWNPWGNGKTSLRAGFRLSYFQDAYAMLDGNLGSNEGLSVDEDCEPTNGNCRGNNSQFLRIG